LSSLVEQRNRTLIPDLDELLRGPLRKRRPIPTFGFQQHGAKNVHTARVSQTRKRLGSRCANAKRFIRDGHLEHGVGGSIVPNLRKRLQSGIPEKPVPRNKATGKRSDRPSAANVPKRPGGRDPSQLIRPAEHREERFDVAGITGGMRP
jgi:hypothetical protein